MLTFFPRIIVLNAVESVLKNEQRKQDANTVTEKDQKIFRKNWY